jgi:hypothetical protein
MAIFTALTNLHAPESGKGKKAACNATTEPQHSNNERWSLTKLALLTTRQTKCPQLGVKAKNSKYIGLILLKEDHPRPKNPNAQ